MEREVGELDREMKRKLDGKRMGNKRFGRV